ncbi:hypothetical protein VU06_02215, partial [Desulfobulbus sp. F3]|nr:hypothetical protein [Desulfobulbus sp. F3]
PDRTRALKTWYAVGRQINNETAYHRASRPETRRQPVEDFACRCILPLQGQEGGGKRPFIVTYGDREASLVSHVAEFAMLSGKSA